MPLTADWAAVCARMATGVRAALAATPAGGPRSHVLRRGMGGDATTAIDQLAEDVVVRELEVLAAQGVGFRLVSEELGERVFGDPQGWTVIVDPVDGSLNAKRGLPFHCLSVAVADGDTVGDVVFGAVHDLSTGEAWQAERGKGATVDGRPLGGEAPREPFELVLLEATVRARLVAEAADRLDGHCSRLRLMGALALALCQLADGRADALATLVGTRAVDIAAAQLVVREAGATVIAPAEPRGLDGMPLDLERRSRLFAAGDADAARRLATLLTGTMPA